MRTSHVASTPYLRRLILLGIVMLAVVGLLLARLADLAIAQGPRHLEAAERVLERHELLPTWRGRILDRNGTTLAEHRTGYAIGIPYRVITREWAREEAIEAARDELGETRWDELDAAAREREIAARRGPFDARIDGLYRAVVLETGLSIDEFNARLRAIHDDVQRLAEHVWRSQHESEAKRRGLAVAEYDDFVPRPIREQVMVHTLLEVDEETAFRVQRLERAYAGLVQMRTARRRVRPLTETPLTVIDLDRAGLPPPLRDSGPRSIRVAGLGDALIGSMRDAWAPDVKARPLRSSTGAIDLGGYDPAGDRLGARGLEEALEPWLRGTRGMATSRLDTGEIERVEPRPGADLRLTIDAGLQARVRALLDPSYGLTRAAAWQGGPPELAGRGLDAAAVVLEIETGEILALASTPTRGDAARMSDAEVQERYPYVNRAIGRAYPPGSILKPLMLCFAVTEGVHRLYEEIDCTGHFFPNVKTVARCWIYRERFSFGSHGALAADEAIARSCNVYFYTLADRLGADALIGWLRRLGVGRSFDLGLDEHPGSLPAGAALEALRSGPSARFDTIILGIGQGQIAWTPLQAADAYATLARGGRMIPPRLILDDPRPDRPEPTDLRFDPGAVEAALRGLRAGVRESHGTSNHVQSPEGESPGWTHVVFPPDLGATIWGKSGTAQAPPPLFDVDRNGAIDAEEEALRADHAWWVGLAGPEGGRPKYAIAVLVEHGGSGGKAAGPIAAEIVRALRYHGLL